MLQKWFTQSRIFCPENKFDMVLYYNIWIFPFVLKSILAENLDRLKELLCVWNQSYKFSWVMFLNWNISIWLKLDSKKITKILCDDRKVQYWFVWPDSVPSLRARGWMHEDSSFILYRVFDNCSARLKGVLIISFCVYWKTKNS